MRTPKIEHWISSVLFVFLAAFLIVPNPSRAVDAATIAEDLDNYFVPAYPDVYGGILEKFPEEEIKNYKQIMTGLEWLGYVQTVSNVATKLGGGDYSGATLDAASTVIKAIISKTASETTKEVLIYGIGVPALPLTLLVTTLDIARASYAAVDASQTALDLERLYYKIEADPVLKTQGRKLGEGNPIRLDLQAREHLWRIIYTDPDFEGVFKTYVTTVLGKEWPEPSLWDKVTTSSDLLREATLLAEQNRIKDYITALLSELNKVAKKRESAVVLGRLMQELAATGVTFSADEFGKALEYLNFAIIKLPEAKTYLTAFPDKFTDLQARIDKATPTELTAIRKEIISEQTTISLLARAMRGFYSKGKYAGERTTTLTELKADYAKLDSLYNAIPKAEINRRLEAENNRIIAEAASLDTAGVSFDFVRHECTKTFDDVKSPFFDKVMSGAGDALPGVNQAKDLVNTLISEMKALYAKDYLENETKYQDAAAKLGEQIASVQQAYDAATDTNTKSALYAQLEKLRQQAVDLKERFTKYGLIHATTSGVDLEDCGNVITEIDKFYAANQNVFAISLASLGEQSGTAQALYFAFMQNYGTGKFGGAVGFLPTEELGKLKTMVANAPDTYLGINLTFLKALVNIDKTKTVSRNVRDTITAISGALQKYMDATGVMRMQYYPSYETSTLPRLQFMESSNATSAVQGLMNALDSAIAAYQNADPSHIPQVSKQEFAGTLAWLRTYKADLEAYPTLIGTASGLSATMEAYLVKAVNQNASVEEDMAYLSSLWQRFETARQLLEGNVGMALIKAATWSFALGTTPPVLTGETVMSAFDPSDILGLSVKLGLGIETLMPTNGFFEVKAKEGFITITVDDITRLTSKIQALPTSDLTAFWSPFHAMRQSSGAEGFLTEGYVSLGNNLWPMFSFNKIIEAAGQMLRDTIEAQRGAAENNQSGIDNANARFALILDRANLAITAVKQYIAQGQFDSAIIYYTVRDDLMTQYGSLTEKRADVDAALKELADLIAQAQNSLVTGGVAGNGQTGAINVVSGWNLLGNSLIGTLDVGTAFGNISNVTTVWKWIASGAKWAFYSPSLAGQALADYANSKGYEVLTGVNGGEGFWVNAKTAFTVQWPTGTAITSTSLQTIPSGWNLISIGDNKTPSEFNALATPNTPLTTLWAWDATQTNWYFYSPSLESTGGLLNYIQSKSYLDFGTKTLTPTMGFWVNKP